MPTATIGKWGNAAAIRIPQSFCEQMNVHIGDLVSISLDNNCLVVEKPFDEYTLEARLANWSGEQFIAHEYDWGSPVGEEIW